jgi:glycosyltransferase involved in cell wall biosynthesis
MQKLNVLFISSWYPSREHPTLGNFIQKHAESVNSFVNLEVLYVASSEQCKGKLEVDYSKINGVSTTVVYYKKTTNKLPFVSNVLKYLRSKKAFKKGYSYIKEKKNSSKFDITHCNITFPAGHFALYLKKTEKTPYVISENWTVFLPYRDDYKNLSFMVKGVIKGIVRNANLMLPVSDYLAHSMAKLGLKQNYKVVPNVVDTNLFSLGSKLITQKKEIIHISTMDDAQKNVSGMFRVIKSISEYRSDFIFRVISDDNHANTQRLLTKFGLDEKIVIIEKTKSTQEIADSFKKAAFSVLFSNYETFSVVLAESWSCGVPVVYSKCGGLTDVKNKALGIQIEPKNESQLEVAIINMLDNYEKYDSKLIRGYAVKNFESKSIGEKFLGIYKEVVNHDT